MPATPEQHALLDHPSTAKEAHTSWRRKALECHPDKCPEDEGAHARFIALSDARDAVIHELDGTEEGPIDLGVDVNEEAAAERAAWAAEAMNAKAAFKALFSELGRARRQTRIVLKAATTAFAALRAKHESDGKAARSAAHEARCFEALPRAARLEERVKGLLAAGDAAHAGGRRVAPKKRNAAALVQAEADEAAWAAPDAVHARQRDAEAAAEAEAVAVVARGVEMAAAEEVVARARVEVANADSHMSLGSMLFGEEGVGGMGGMGYDHPEEEAWRGGGGYAHAPPEDGNGSEVSNDGACAVM